MFRCSMQTELMERADTPSNGWQRICIYDITAHSAFPLLMVRNIGIISFLVSMVMAVYYLVRYFTMGISVEGWTSQMLVMLAFFGLVLLSIGIMGIYLMNILNEAKKMPHYVIRREDTEEK